MEMLQKRDPGKAVLKRVLADNPGKGHRKLALILGVSDRTVFKWLKKHGLKTGLGGPVSNRRPCAEAVDAAINLGDTTPYQLKRRFEITWDMAARILADRGLWRRPGKRKTGKKEADLRPRCRICGDLLDETDPIWGGASGAHYTCQAHEQRRGTVIYRDGITKRDIYEPKLPGVYVDRVYHDSQDPDGCIITIKLADSANELAQQVNVAADELVQWWYNEHGEDLIMVEEAHG